MLKERYASFDAGEGKRFEDGQMTLEELVAYAFRVNEFRTNLTLKNVGDTLTKWHDQGIKTAEDAARFSEEEHKENKRKATRRKANAGSVWATGEEAGIAAETKAEEPKNTKASEDTNDDDGDSNIPDSVLDMFGD